MNFSGSKTYFRAGRFGLAIVFLFALCASAFAAPSVKASLDRNTISLGESATLSFTFTETSAAPPPNLPAIANLQIAHAGQSSQFSIVNGQTSSSLTHNFQITPTTAGEFSIPTIRVNVGGTMLASQPLTLKVVQGQAPAATEEKLPAFLKLIVSKNQIFVGEPIPVEIQLYFQEARDAHLPQLPSEGFTVGNMQHTQSQTRVSNEVYIVVTFKLPVFATRTGALMLGPATLNLKLLMGPRDFFGQRSQARPVTLNSESQTLQVLPLPQANQPANFNGAIGNFSMTFNAAPTNVAVGDPITLKVKISGRGSLDLLSLPAQADWREFKTYPATSKVESGDPLGLEGTKTFEQIIVPQNSEIRELPAFAFSFFDPDQKQYRTLTNAAVPLVVRPTAATPQPTIFSSNADAREEQSAREIVHIKPQLGMVQAVSAPLIQQPWFLFLQGAAPLLWMTSVVLRKRKEALQNNPRLRREREVAATVTRGMRELSQYAAAKETDQFFATVFRLLQEQLGERLDLPASGITESVIDEKLRPMGADAATIDLVHELFQACNQARYAAQKSREELASCIPKMERALAELRKLK